MKTVRLTGVLLVALALFATHSGVAAGTGDATAGIAAARAGSPLRGLSPADRRARRLELRYCRRSKAARQRGRCLKRVRAKYRRIAQRRTQAGPDPVEPTAIHEVLATDNTTNAIQSSYFIPFEQIERDDTGMIREPAVPTTLRIRAGEAVRFVWDDQNRDSPHTIAPWSYPPGVNPWDFTFGASAALGVTFQRTFTVRGRYEFRCSLHHETQILELTVTR